MGPINPAMLITRFALQIYFSKLNAISSLCCILHYYCMWNMVLVIMAMNLVQLHLTWLSFQGDKTGQGPISWMTVPSYYKFCSHSSCRKVIIVKLCTWHDSCAVSACAKFCSDMISCYGITLKPIFCWILNMMEKSFVKSTPGRIC